MIDQQEKLQRTLKKIILRREKIKEDYIKAWLASAVQDENLNVDWLIQNVRLVETRSADCLRYSWHLEMLNNENTDFHNNLSRSRNDVLVFKEPETRRKT